MRIEDFIFHKIVIISSHFGQKRFFPWSLSFTKDAQRSFIIIIQFFIVKVKVSYAHLNNHVIDHFIYELHEIVYF